MRSRGARSGLKLGRKVHSQRDIVSTVLPLVIGPAMTQKNPTKVSVMLK